MSASAHLVRPWSDRIIAGVCAGLGDRIGVEPWVLRVGFILSSFVWGAGLALYALLWLLLPPVGDRDRRLGHVARANLERLPDEVAHGRDRLLGAWSRRGRDARIASVALLGGGAAVLMWSFGAFNWLTASRLIAVAAIVAGAAVLWSGGRR